MINTTSTVSTPICSPQLPPEIVMKAGALQPLAVRQVATPLPPLPPKTKPALTMCGTTATHFACSNTSSGIPLSDIPIISCNTLVALSSRSVASSRADPAQHGVPRLNIASKIITFFIGTASFLPLWQEQYSHPEHKSAVDMPGTLGQYDLSKLGSNRSEQYCSRRTCPSKKRACWLVGVAATIAAEPRGPDHKLIDVGLQYARYCNYLWKVS